MKKKLLYLVFIICFISAKSQTNSGDTINDAIPVNGTYASLNVLNYDNATHSGLLPACDASEDVFYLHTISLGHNKLTIAMASVGVNVLARVDYQILLAPNGNLNNLSEVTCDHYDVPVLANGGFENIIENVHPGDVYYLRVYNPSGLGADRSNFISSSSITMLSEFDLLLSNEDIEEKDIKYVINESEVKLLNNNIFNHYKIYNIDGKKVSENIDNETINSIKIEQLNSGMYILALENKENSKTVLKFIK